MKIFSVLALAACLFSLVEADDKIYLSASNTKDLIAKEGQIVVVHGETERSARIASGMNFVNFAGSEFVLVTFKSDLDQFPDGEPHELYNDKRVAVEGPISIYKDKPQIKLVSPRQVTILEPDAAFPPMTPEKMEKPEVVVETTTAKKKPEEKTEPEPEKRKPPVDASEFFK